MPLQGLQKPPISVGRRSNAICAASLGRGDGERRRYTNYAGDGSKQTSSTPYGGRRSAPEGRNVGMDERSSDRDSARSPVLPSTYGRSGRGGAGRGRGQGRGEDGGERMQAGSNWGRGRTQDWRGRGRGRGLRYGRSDPNDVEEDDKDRRDGSQDGDFIVIGQADSSTGRQAANKTDPNATAAAAAASPPSATANKTKSSGDTLLDGSRFWIEASGISDEDLDEDEDEEADEEEDVEDTEAAVGDDAPQSPEQLLANMRQLGFTLQHDTALTPPTAAAAVAASAGARSSQDPQAASATAAPPADSASGPLPPAAGVAALDAAAEAADQSAAAAGAGGGVAAGAAAGADLALRELRDTFLATLQPPGLPPWFLGPVEPAAAKEAGSNRKDRKREGGSSSSTAGTGEASSSSTTGATGRGVSLRTTRAVAAGELLAVSLPLAIRYCRRGTTPENEELAELMMMTPGGCGGEGEQRGRAQRAASAAAAQPAAPKSYVGLTDLQQSLLGLLPMPPPQQRPQPSTEGKESGSSSGSATTATNASNKASSNSSSGGGGGGARGPAIKRAFLQMVSQSAADGGAPRSAPLLAAAELYDRVNANCMGEDFQDLALCKLRGERPMGHIALWPEAALTAHSCAPTATAYTVGDRLVVRAAADIPKGGEVSLNWLGSLLTTPLEVRRAELRQQYGFTCGCSRCTAEARYSGTPLSALLASVYDTCQLLAPQLDAALAAGQLRAVGAAREQLRGLQEQVEAALRGADPRVNAKVRRWLQASVYDMYDLISLSADELASSSSPSSSSPSSFSSSSIVETESLVQCCRIVEGVTPGSDAHVYLAAELVMRCLERFGPKHEEYMQARAGLVRAYGTRYGNVGPAVMEQLVAARLAAEADEEGEEEEGEEEEEEEERVGMLRLSKTVRQVGRGRERDEGKGEEAEVW